MDKQAFLGPNEWVEAIKGYLIVDLAIRDKNIIYLCLRKSIPQAQATLLLNNQIPSRLTAIYLDEPPGENFGNQEIEGMNFPLAGVSRLPFPKPTGLMSSRDKDGDVWPHGSAGSGPMEQIAMGQRPSPKRLKCINGYTYSIGNDRKIHKRIAVGNWERFPTAGLTFAKDVPGIDKMSTSRMLEVTGAFGFSDLDAFSDADMYAVGGRGDVWHYDGKQWSQMGFPSNVQLGTVTCAGDGNVYISGEGGSLWVGQKSTWKSIYKGGSSILWNDALWFENKLWLSSDYQFRIWNGEDLETVTHEGKNVPMNGHMDAYDGLLAIASSEYVMTYDGKDWKTIVAPYLN